MRHKIILTIALLLAAWSISAQERVEYVDSVIYRPAATVDSTLVGRSVQSVLGEGGNVQLHQSQAISSALDRHIASNAGRTIQGFRVRIYFDNCQTARKDSQQTLVEFTRNHPGVQAYLNYQNPFFKVTVGDFRTRSEAMELLERIRGEYPAAFVVKESINYPVVEKSHAYVVDTVKVIKRTL